MQRKYLSLTLIASVVIVLVMIGLRAQYEMERSGRLIGMTIDDSRGGLEVTFVNPDYPAQKAGIQAGDEVIAVEGVPVENLSSLLDEVSQWHRGREAHLTVARGASQTTVTLKPGGPFPWSRVLLDLFCVIGYAAVGLLAHFRAPPGVRSRLLALFSMAVALELSMPLTISFLPQWVLWQSVFFYLLSGIQLGLELHLASVLPRRYSWFTDRPYLVKVYYTIGFGVGLVTAVLSVAEYYNLSHAANLAVIARTAMNDVVLVSWGLAVVAILLVQFINSKTPGLRSQALLILVGVVPWALYNVVNTVISMTDMTVGTWFDLAQPFVLLIYPVAIFIAIFRYHLFDIKLVLRRSLVLILVTGVVLILFTLAFEAVASSFGKLESASRFQVAFFALIMLILGVAFNPVRQLIQRAVDRKFYPEKIAQREHLAEIAANLPSLGNLDSIGRHVVEEVARVFQVTSATLMVSDPHSGLLVSLATAAENPATYRDVSLLLESNDAAIEQLRQAGRPLPADIISSTSPAMAQRINAVGAETGIGLISGTKLVGLLLLGQGKERAELTAEEQDLLRLFSHNLATVLENVRLFQSATYEQLTGLLRREAILSALDAEINRASRYSRPLTVGLVDLDHFKKVNDVYGHLAGDALLQRVAAELKLCLRSTDQIGRYGGEEFLFFLPETSISHGTQVAEKLRIAIESMPSPIKEAPDLRITASIGLAELEGSGDTPPPTAEIIGAADAALLQSKEAGRNRVVTAPHILRA